MTEPNNLAQPNLQEGTNLEQDLSSSEPDFDKPAAELSNSNESAPASASASETVSNLGEKTAEIGNNIKETTSQISDKLQEYQKSSSGQIITMTIVGILVVAAIALILYYIIRSTMISQTSYILKNTKVPVLCTNITVSEGSSIPNPSSGVRSGMCFWIYIYDISKYQGSVRHVFHRGTKNDGFNTGNTLPMGPYVALDPSTSAMSILFGPGITSKTGNYYNYNIQSSTGPGIQNKYTDSDLKGSSKATKSGVEATMSPTPSQLWQVASQSRGIVFPYVPLQRWVHVACVINENVNGGTITGYIDGELAVTVNSSSKTVPVQVTTSGTGTRTVKPVLDVSNINMKNTGDVYIGGSISDPIGPGFSGLISKVQFYNYDISAQDVYANYQSGPIDNILSKLGLPAYGLRSPIYEIE